MNIETQKNLAEQLRADLLDLQDKLDLNREIPVSTTTIFHIVSNIANRLEAIEKELSRAVFIVP